MKETHAEVAYRNVIDGENILHRIRLRFEESPLPADKIVAERLRLVQDHLEVAISYMKEIAK